MAVRLYDEALCNKLQKWIRDEKLTVLKPNETTRLFRQLADQKLDKPLTLPLIAISRDPDIKIFQTNKKPLSFDGMMLKSVVKGTTNDVGDIETITEGKSVQLDAIPIEIDYHIDIYTRHFAEADDYMRNFVFQIINHPKLLIEIPYNSKESGLEYKLLHVANIRLTDTVTDNSDIKEKLYFDEFTRWTLNITIDDAYLFSVPIKDNAVITVDDDDLFV